MLTISLAFSALTLLVGQQEGHPACKKTEWWGAGVVVCLERGADLHVAQLMPLPLTVSCFSKIQIGFTFLVLADLGSPGKGQLNGCVCVWLPPCSSITVQCFSKLMHLIALVLLVCKLTRARHFLPYLLLIQQLREVEYTCVSFK